MTTEQAAEYLNVSKRTIFRLIDRGTIKAEKFGPVYMIKKADLDEYKAAIEGKSKNDPTRGKLN